jgi:hypothetical protein
MSATEMNADTLFFRNVADEPWLEPSETDRARITEEIASRVKWLGGDATSGPWVYWVHQPAGHRVRPHKHPAARVEFVLDGEIEFFEGDDALRWWRGDDTVTGSRHGTGTLSYVPVGTVYSYLMTKDTTLLHVFFDNPLHGTVHLD